MTDEELDAANARGEAVFAAAVIAAVAEFPYVVAVAGPGSDADEKLGVRTRRLVRELSEVAP